MRDFQFVKTGEVAGSWEPGNAPTWRLTKGNHFFLATWTRGKTHFGWFGIDHEALTELDRKTRCWASIITQILDSRRRWPELAELSEITPGWGIIRACPEQIHLFRDPVGRLPISWAQWMEGVEWGTRPTVLTRFDGTIRRTRVEKFLARTKDYERDDFWEGIWRVRAGECLVASRPWSPCFIDWWPDINAAPDSESPPEQIVGDLLVQSLNQTAARGGYVVSLSGGVDSTLLLALLTTQGNSSDAVSMIAPGTEVFDERETIETTLEALGCRGTFFDISGPMAWAKPEFHHPNWDFGPSTHSQSAYVRPLLNSLVASFGEERSPILISGAGADQLFSCPMDRFVADLPGINGPSVAIRRRRWKWLVQWTVRELGGSRLPARMPKDRIPPWLCCQRNSRKRDLRWSKALRQSPWQRWRKNQFKSWLWESVIRLNEQYRRTTGVLYEFPYLEPKVVECALALSPSAMRTEKHDKMLLRKLLRSRVPDAVAFRRKTGVFDEVVWKGICRYLEPPLDELFTGSYLERAGLASENKLRKYAEETGASLRTIGRTYGQEFWRAVSAELWMRDVKGRRRLIAYERKIDSQVSSFSV